MSPVVAESLAMPAEDRRRLHEHEGVAPRRPASTQTHPQESIDGAKSRAAVASGQQLQLMSEREILQDEILMSAECGPEGGDEGQAEPKHAGQCERSRARKSTISGRS
jgi:hypothetical protein